MTGIDTLQGVLRAAGLYGGRVDGKWGTLTRAATLVGLTIGPDTKLTDRDIELSASILGVTPAHIMAVRTVESGGAGFTDGRPTILFEPHRFAKATGGRFNASHPHVSYQAWGSRPYPAGQAARYEQLLDAIALDVDAGFASASYGLFQILGENFNACGFWTPGQFALAMARDERAQLEALEGFLRTNGLVEPLRRGDWAAFARGYNGTAYRANRYDEKLAAAFRAAGGR